MGENPFPSIVKEIYVLNMFGQHLTETLRSRSVVSGFLDDFRCPWNLVGSCWVHNLNGRWTSHFSLAIWTSATQGFQPPCYELHASGIEPHRSPNIGCLRLFPSLEFDLVKWPNLATPREERSTKSCTCCCTAPTSAALHIIYVGGTYHVRANPGDMPSKSGFT